MKLNIKKLQFIPNGKYEEISNLIAKDGEKKVEIIHDRTMYGTDKNNMSQEKTEEFCYPCVYTTVKDGTVNFWYSSKNTNGHFNIPKVFCSNGSSSTAHCDMNGEYGLTQFAYAIVDSVENLENIKKAMESEKFIQIMKFCMFTNHKYSYNIIAQFRKDFYKDFI